MARRSLLEQDSSPVLDDGDYTAEADQQPLLGVILCCTSILPEERDRLCDIAREMGAITKLDLTSEVTHLMVGHVDTAKYKFVAKERPDVHVLGVSWLHAVHNTWLEGHSIDLEQFDESYRLPTFFNLCICITGFEDPAERAILAEHTTQNGARYSGDLTKEVTHLIAAAPKGKKYQFAGQWGVKIVSEEWLYQSMARRMVLDESLYDPLTEKAERGKGAYKQLPQLPNIRKRTSNEDIRDPNRRKLRRTTSSRLESQNGDLWADIGPSEDAAGPAQSSASLGKPIAIRSEPAQGDQHTSVHTKYRTKQPPATEEAPSFSAKPFHGERICIRGFAEARVTTLLEHLGAGGAQTISWEDLKASPEAERKAITLLLPHDAEGELLEEAESIPKCQVVSEWWVEKCIFNKRNMAKDRTDCRPIGAGTIQDFPKVKVCPTSFVGIDLMHFSKAMRIAGAQYDEILTHQTSILVCGAKSTTSESGKVRYAIAHSIPVVDEAWAWACIQKRKLVSYERYLTPGQDKAVLHQRNFLSTAPARRPAETKKSDSPSKRNSPATSRALQEIAPRANSQSQRSDDKDESLESVMRQVGKRPVVDNDEEDENNLIVNLENKEEEEEAIGEEGQRTTHKDRLKDALAQLQRSKKDEDETASAPPGSRKHRLLGRVQSNPSSFNAKSASEPIASFKTAAEEEQEHNRDEGNDDDDDAEEEDERPGSRMSREMSHGAFRPSQRLSYENDESAVARQQLLKARSAGLDGSTDDGRAEQTRRRVERVGVVRDAVGRQHGADQRQPATRKTTRRR